MTVYPEKITKETKYLESIGKWCCGIWCFRDGKNSIWTGGYFHKNREKAEEMAMDSFLKSLAFYREIERPADKTEETIYA